MKAVIPPRQIGFDTASCVTEEIAHMFHLSGYRFAVRYLRLDRHVNERPDLSGGVVSLSNEELEWLLNARLCVSLVQFFADTPPSADRGERQGRAAAWNAKRLQAPAGITIWRDLEWGKRTYPAKDVLADATAWWYGLQDEGGGRYSAGLYVGANNGLNSQQLMSLPYRHYWKSMSAVRWPSRGFQLVQGTEITVHGLQIDQDLAMIDNYADRCRMISR